MVGKGEAVLDSVLDRALELEYRPVALSLSDETPL